MTTRYKTKGFVFKREDVLESDRVFSIFTKDWGRIEIFAKAIRKITSKLRGGMELFSFSYIEFIQGKNQKTLTDAVSLNEFSSIKKSDQKIKIALKICQSLDDFLKGQEPDEKIWILMNNLLSKLNNLGEKKLIDIFYYYFFWNFLSALGYEPELFQCVLCSQKLDPSYLYFSFEQGGVVCKKCKAKDNEAEKIDPNVVKILRLFLVNNWDLICKLKIELETKKLLQIISEKYYKYLSRSYSF